MDAETLLALRGSIAKWEAIVAGTGIDGGSKNCPLCQKFNKEELGKRYEVDEDGNSTDACEGCPVRDATGLDWCHGSPYRAFTDARWRKVHETDEAFAQRFALRGAHAQAELDFLKSLLPVKP
jgi:hypothetical protein